MADSLHPRKGHPFPLGANPYGKGINFALHAPKADRARLVIYPCGEDSILGTFDLNADNDKKHNVFCISIEGLPASFDYCWFLEGAPKDPRDIPFDPARPVVDPYARFLNTPSVWKDHGQVILAEKTTLKARYCPSESFDWQNVEKPSIPLEKLIIYEMHVRGFTI